MNSASSSPAVRVAITSERVALARKTHGSVLRFMIIVFGILIAALLGVGIPLSLSGRASLVGLLIVALIFALVPVLVWWTNKRTLTRAERFLARDGETVLSVGPDSITIADIVVPFEKVTCVYFNLEKEVYGGTVAKGVGGRMGTGQRRKLYSDGAKSWGELMIGVQDRTAIEAPEGFINPLRTLPKSGFDSGRIDIPFGALLNRADVDVFLGALQEPAARHGIPHGVVTGIMNWSNAQVGAADAPDKIRADAAGLLTA